MKKILAGMNAKIESLQAELLALRSGQDVILQHVKRLASGLALRSGSDISYGEKKTAVCEQCGSHVKKVDLLEKSFLINSGNYMTKKLCKKCFYNKHNISKV